jgi:DNA invertase Pin-like site-specific DNA recombinase
MRIGIYARVSTKDQSCELQIRDLRAYCAARGFELVREYVDVGQSGAKDSRPELNKLMDDARKRQFDAIVVWRFDRFARSTKHLLTALEGFRSLGIQFISYQENVDTSTSLGQALFTIVSAVAQLERDLIRERVSAGIRNARANGKQFGRPKNGVDPERIRQLRAQGNSLQRIATILGIGYGTVRSKLQPQTTEPRQDSSQPNQIPETRENDPCVPGPKVFARVTNCRGSAISCTRANTDELQNE